jgi:MSHA biogenesis protein MshG
MAHFKYKARNQSGQLIESVIDADTPQIAAQMLANRGLIPVSIQPTLINTDVLEQFYRWHALRSLNLTDLILFSRQMYSLTKAGVPLIRSLRSLSESTRNKALTEALKNISKRLESGSSLSQAMMQQDKIFSPLYISIINVGETTGGLDQAFAQLAYYLEREKETQSRIKSALRYPTMVLSAIGIALMMVNIYVIPSFKTVFEKAHSDLPWQTQLLINISDYSVAYWPHIGVGLICLFWLVASFINTPSGRLLWDRMLLRIPIIGSIVERATMERFSRSFAMILHSGVPLIQGIMMVSDAIGNTYVGSKLAKMRIGIEKGDSISRMARSTQLFPSLVLQMIMVGEETGNISDMLVEVADFYELEIDAELKNLATAIEPILIVIIGLMVLVLALGIFLPMWNLSSALN